MIAWKDEKYVKVIDCIADWSECAMPSSVPLPELHADCCAY